MANKTNSAGGIVATIDAAMADRAAVADADRARAWAAFKALMQTGASPDAAGILEDAQRVLGMSLDQVLTIAAAAKTVAQAAAAAGERERLRQRATLARTKFVEAFESRRARIEAIERELSQLRAAADAADRAASNAMETVAAAESAQLRFACVFGESPSPWDPAGRLELLAQYRQLTRQLQSGSVRIDPDVQSERAEARAALEAIEAQSSLDRSIQTLTTPDKAEKIRQQTMAARNRVANAEVDYSAARSSAEIQTRQQRDRIAVILRFAGIEPDEHLHD